MTLIIIIWSMKMKISFLFLTLLHFSIFLVTTTGSTYDPEFDLPLANLTAKQGTDISFTCVVKHLREYRVAWIKSDDKAILAWHTNMVTNNHRYSVTHNGHNTWTLHIKNIQQNDSGTFMCQVNTDPMRMQIGTLEVVVPADIIDEETSSDVVVVEGQRVVLQCKASGHPPPKIQWQREDGQPLPLSKEVVNPGETLSMWEGETLPLKPLNHEHTGWYLCIANNSYPPRVSKRIRVEVRVPPVIKVTNQLVAAPADINVTLECEVVSVPTAFISWGTKTKDGQKLIMTTQGKYLVTNEPMNDYTMKIKLLILFLQEQDFTEYNVTATNTMGEATAVIRVHRIPPPETPRPSPTTTHRTIKHIDHYNANSNGRLNHNSTRGKHSKFHRKNSNGVRGSSSSHGHSQQQQHRNHLDSESSYYEDFETNGGDGFHHVTTMISNFNNNNNIHHYGNNHQNNSIPSNNNSNMRNSTPKSYWGKSANGSSSSITSVGGLTLFQEIMLSMVLIFYTPPYAAAFKLI